MNFMLPVPDASLLAVEICSLTSAAAKINLCVGNAVIFDKHNFQLTIDGFIIVDHICYGVNQLDRQLGNLVTCRCFRTKDKGSRNHIHVWIVFELVIQVHYMKDI